MATSNLSNAEVKESVQSSSTTNSSMGKRSANDFKFGRLIGEGSFSSVYLAQDIHTGEEYAIKTCIKTHIQREKKIQSVMREKEVMNMLNSGQDPTAPFFVKLYYAFHCETYLHFVMTYCENGELLKWIRKVGNFDTDSAAFYCAEIVKALEHLHSKKIIHRDLKPENIILDGNMHIKITDFGSAKILTDDDVAGRRSSFEGTPQYVSPEVLEANPVTPAADLWALGCIAYQVVAGLPPFNDPSEYLIAKQILKLEYTFPDAFPEHARDLVQKLLVKEDRKRLGALDTIRYSSLRAHPFFRGLNFDLLYKQTPPEICTPLEPPPTLEWQKYMETGLKPTVLQRIELQDIAGESLIYNTNEVKTKEKNKPLLSLERDLRLTVEEHKAKLEAQEKNIYNQYVDGCLIIKQGLLDKKKGMFPRRRMFLLTTGPRLFYVDPAAGVLKGEVPLNKHTRMEPKNFRTFYLHTPNRTYYLEDPAEKSNEWCDAVRIVIEFYFS